MRDRSDEEIAKIDYAVSFVRDAFNRGQVHPQACIRLLDELDQRRRRHEPEPWTGERILGHPSALTALRVRR